MSPCDPAIRFLSVSFSVESGEKEKKGRERKGETHLAENDHPLLQLLNHVPVIPPTQIAVFVREVDALKEGKEESRDVVAAEVEDHSERERRELSEEVRCG